ncbi:MAG: glycoside hydrolase family 9 protein [Cohnella sp.]|nr:glycoside hydrolase family 9 protein [Cohnella sp.]
MNRRKTSTMAYILTIAVAFGAVTAGCDGNDKPAPTVSPTATVEQTAAPEPSDSPRIEGLRLHVDQVGYLPESPKTLVVAADEPFPAMAVQVVASGGDDPVWEGTLPAATADANSGDWVARADFGALATDGAYEAVAGGNRSDPFRIGDDVFNDVWAKVARSYTAQRANFEQDDPFTGLKLLAGHKQDKEARLFFKDEGNPSVIDASGGWYDAGDYGKYVPTAAITVGQLLAAYELDPAAAAAPFLTERETAFWPVAANAPHLLAEVKYELDWMLRMQRKDGAVYHKVSAMSFPAYILPAEDLQDRYVFGLSTFGTAMFAGATAMGARLFEPYDAEYAKELLDHAKKAEEWLSAHPDAYFRYDEGQDSGSGPYSKATDREERLWALAELFKTTGDGTYDAIIQRDYADMLGKPPGIASFDNAQLLGQWALATAEKTPSAVRDEAAAAIAQAADVIAGRIGEDGYRSSLAANEYTWGSNKVALANAQIMLLANRLKPNEAYSNGALEQLHYVLGRNAMGISYVTGIGSRYPLKPHHRISLMSGVKVPGLMVGGPNRFGDEPVRF